MTTVMMSYNSPVMIPCLLLLLASIRISYAFIITVQQVAVVGPIIRNNYNNNNNNYYYCYGLQECTSVVRTTSLTAYNGNGSAGSRSSRSSNNRSNSNNTHDSRSSSSTGDGGKPKSKRTGKPQKKIRVDNRPIDRNNQNQSILNFDNNNAAVAAAVPTTVSFKSSYELATELQSKQYFYSKKDIESSEFSLDGDDGTFLKLCSSVEIDRPSRIQALAWPALLSGKHVIVADQTGSGKTLAYLLPLLQRMKMNESDYDRTTRGNGNDVSSAIKLLILAPTAELCDQVRNVCAKISGKSGVKFRTMVATANGQNAAPIREQIRELQNTNVDVLVSTPGRVAAFLKAGAVDLSLLQAVVLDEVDILMIDETFGPQLRTVGVAAPIKTQFVFATATLPDTVVSNVKSEFPGVIFIKGPGLHKVAPNVQEQ